MSFKQPNSILKHPIDLPDGAFTFDAKTRNNKTKKLVYFNFKNAFIILRQAISNALILNGHKIPNFKVI